MIRESKFQTNLATEISETKPIQPHRKFVQALEVIENTISMIEMNGKFKFQC
jgi:hypothetical protein